PAIARQRRAQRDESAYAAFEAEADDQGRTDVQRRQTRRLRNEIAARVRGVADLYDAQMSQPVAEVRKPLERLALQDFRIERREHARRRDEAFDAGAILIERREQHDIESGRFAKCFEILFEDRIAGVARQILK